MQIDSPEAVDQFVRDAYQNMNHRADALARIEYARDHFLDVHENPRFSSREDVIQRFDRHIHALQS